MRRSPPARLFAGSVQRSMKKAPSSAHARIDARRSSCSTRRRIRGYANNRAAWRTVRRSPGISLDSPCTRTASGDMRQERRPAVRAAFLRRRDRTADICLVITSPKGTAVAPPCRNHPAGRRYRCWSTAWPSHSSNRISPSRASPAGISERSPSSAPKYRACGSTTTSRGSLRAARP